MAYSQAELSDPLLVPDESRVGLLPVKYHEVSEAGTGAGGPCPHAMPALVPGARHATKRVDICLCRFGNTLRRPRHPSGAVGEVARVLAFQMAGENWPAALPRESSLEYAIGSAGQCKPWQAWMECL
jgi:hypothetical protein